MSFFVEWLRDVPPTLALMLIGVGAVVLPVIVVALGRAAVEALHDRGGRMSRLLTAVSDWFYFSTPAVPAGEAPPKRPGVHKVRRRIVLDSVTITVRRTCSAYRELGLHRTTHRIPVEQFDEMAGKRTYTGDLLRSLQAELRELARYETGTAALKLPRRPTYDELCKLRAVLKRLHRQPDEKPPS